MYNDIKTRWFGPFSLRITAHRGIDESYIISKIDGDGQN